jgi:hypothetical protein
MAKNFDQIGCIFCGVANIKMDEFCKSCNKPLHIHSSLEKQKIDKLTLIKYKARGFYGLTYKAEDGRGKPFSVKLISKRAYTANGKDFDEEAEAYADLPDHPCIARYIGTGEVDISGLEEKIPFYYIISEWIEGPSLREWIASGELTPNDCEIDLPSEFRGRPEPGRPSVLIAFLTFKRSRLQTILRAFEFSVVAL